MSTLLLLSVVVACSQQSSGSTGSTGTSAPVPEFSADSAWAHLRRQVDFGPRNPGSEGHRQQLAWMQEYLAARADTVVSQSFKHEATDGVVLELTNVFARFNPQARDRILLLAHWDTRPTADEEGNTADRQKPIPGANDGASGVAVLLELANVLSRHSQPLGVDLLFVDGEDYSSADLSIGAKYFAANLPQGYRPLYGILLDMIGDQSPVFMIESNSRSYAPEVIERVWRVAEELGHGSVFSRREGIAITDDHIPLNHAGIRTIDIIDFDYGPGNAYWHTLEDNLDHVSPRGLGIVGAVLTTLIYRGG
jgi:Zn-dependent M28 family amino/carboxypeptidase